MEQHPVESATVEPEQLARALYYCIREAACTLRPDVLEAIRAAWLKSKGNNPDSRESQVLHSMVQNALVGERDNVPICQDTGSVWVCLEVGEEATVPGNVFGMVDYAVAHAYEDGALRMSIVRDALFDRENTKTNAPAFCEIRIVGGKGVRLNVLLKGGGSDNASHLVMLSPDAGEDGVKRAILNRVREKASNACPPLIVGVGVGATFDKVAGMSKHALLRKIGSPAQSERAAAFEREMLDKINALGIGPAALGGMPTALAVHLETAPCHIAALPVAINMGCCAMRSASVDLITPEGYAFNQPMAQTWEGDDVMSHKVIEQEEAVREMHHE